jgi:F-type H+-transporting ATPase subunit delta
MRTSEIAETYARSLFELGSLTGTVTDAEAQLNDVVKTVRGHVDLRDALADATVPDEKKREILREIFGEAVDPAVLSIVQVIVASGNVDKLGDVAVAFSALVEQELGVVPAEVTTAVPLTDQLRASLSAKLEGSLDKRVVLREKVDPEILGGIVIKVAGRVMDGSLKKQLSDMRRALATASAGGEV